MRLLGITGQKASSGLQTKEIGLPGNLYAIFAEAGGQHLLHQAEHQTKILLPLSTTLSFPPMTPPPVPLIAATTAAAAAGAVASAVQGPLAPPRSAPPVHTY